jgi:hypothetical protein
MLARPGATSRRRLIVFHLPLLASRFSMASQRQMKSKMSSARFATCGDNNNLSSIEALGSFQTEFLDS